MTKRQKLAIFIILLIIGGIAVESYMRYKERTPLLPPPLGEEEFPRIGSAAKNFTLAQLGSRIPVSLGQYRGKKAAYLYFWSTQSPFSRDELRDLAQIQHEAGEALVVLAINRADTQNAAAGYAQDHGAEAYPILLDSSDEVWKLYRGRIMPLHIFIDITGVIRDIKTGPLTLQEMRDRIRGISNL